MEELGCGVYRAGVERELASNIKSCEEKGDVMSIPNNPGTAGQNAAEGSANQNSTLLAAISEMKSDLEYQRKQINELIDKLAPVVASEPPSNIEPEKVQVEALGASSVHSVLQEVRTHVKSNTEAVIRLAARLEI